MLYAARHQFTIVKPQTEACYGFQRKVERREWGAKPDGISSVKVRWPHSHSTQECFALQGHSFLHEKKSQLSGYLQIHAQNSPETTIS